MRTYLVCPDIVWLTVHLQQKTLLKRNIYLLRQTFMQTIHLQYFSSKTKICPDIHLRKNSVFFLLYKRNSSLLSRTFGQTIDTVSVENIVIWHLGRGKLWAEENYVFKNLMLCSFHHLSGGGWHIYVTSGGFHNNPTQLYSCENTCYMCHDL